MLIFSLIVSFPATSWSVFVFQLLPCSRCQRTFSVRSEVSDQALLKCPNCGNQFRLGDLLEAFYAPWLILENPGVASAGAGATGSQGGVPAELSAATASTGLSLDGSGVESAPAQSAGLTTAAATTQPEEGGVSLDEPELELADQEESSTGLSLDSGDKDKPKTDWSQFKPITHEEFQRMKRADRSSIWSTLQVVLGGAAAIPVSLLLIWYVLDKDVAGAGPAVARYVPWIVPEKFRGSSLASEPAEPLAEPRRIPRRGESGFRNFDDVMPPADSDDEQPSESAEPNGAPADGAGAVVATLAQDDKESEAAGNSTSTSEAQLPNIDAAPPAPSSAVDAPMADVFALLQRTKKKVEDWKDVATAKDTVKREAAISLFEDLASLGAHFSSIPDTPGAPALARDKAQEIARAIKRQPGLTDVIHSAAKAQLNGNLPRSKNGWALVCTVGQILDQDVSWRIMVADSSLLPLDVPTIEIPKSVAPQLTSGQRLLLLGQFILPPSADDASATAENTENAAPGPEIFRASFSYGL